MPRTRKCVILQVGSRGKLRVGTPGAGVGTPGAGVPTQGMGLVRKDMDVRESLRSWFLIFCLFIYSLIRFLI